MHDWQHFIHLSIHSFIYLYFFIGGGGLKIKLFLLFYNIIIKLIFTVKQNVKHDMF